MKAQFIGIHPDFLGFSASLACAVHCAALPLLMSIVPLAGLSILVNPWVEYAIIVISLFIASYALLHGYVKHHQKGMAITMAIIGFTLIGTGHLLHGELAEILLTTFGGTGIAIAHLINWRLTQKSQTGITKSSVSYDK